jgi:aminopeptidase-like protein
MNYGELVLQGKSKQEILVSTYICHPSMANNELSGPIVSMCLIDYFKKQKNLSKTIRFIFIPETIGSIGYIEKNLTHLKKNVVGGYNLSCIGDERQHSCMFTKYNNTTSDRALVEAYKKLKIKYKIYSFLKRGSDERQYNSPGVDLPIASIFRSKYGEYSEYHTSLDDFSLVTKKGIYGGFSVAKEAIKILLNKEIPKAKYLCEPQMGKRGLYSNLSIKGNRKASIQSMVDFLQYSDGKNDISNISKIIGINLSDAKRTYRILKKNNLLD